MAATSSCPVRAVWAALAISRHLTVPGLIHALDLPEREIENQLETLSDLGWVQPSRDVQAGFRCVNPSLALGSLVLDILDGTRHPQVLASLGGFRHVVQLAKMWQPARHAVFLPSSLDSFSALVEEAVTNVNSDVTVLHTAPLPGSDRFLVSDMGYLRRRGIPVRTVFGGGCRSHPGWHRHLSYLRSNRAVVTTAERLPGRGVIIDGGDINVLHTDTGGCVVTNSHDPLFPSENISPVNAVRVDRIRPLQVLSLLSSGRKTSTIACAIGASSRTVARDIALLQDVFEADSRALLSRNAAYVGLV